MCKKVKIPLIRRGNIWHNNVTEHRTNRFGLKTVTQLHVSEKHRLTFMTSAIIFHCSWVGSVPVGLCAQAWRTKTECSGAFCWERTSQIFKHNHTELMSPNRGFQRRRETEYFNDWVCKWVAQRTFWHVIAGVFKGRLPLRSLLGWKAVLNVTELMDLRRQRRQ